MRLARAFVCWQFQLPPESRWRSNIFSTRSNSEKSPHLQLETFHRHHNNSTFARARQFNCLNWSSSRELTAMKWERAMKALNFIESYSCCCHFGVTWANPIRIFEAMFGAFRVGGKMAHLIMISNSNLMKFLEFLPVHCICVSNEQFVGLVNERRWQGCGRFLKETPKSSHKHAIELS